MNLLLHVGHISLSQVLSVYSSHSEFVSELSPLYTLLIRNKQTRQWAKFQF